MSRKELLKDLKQLGLKQGDYLVAHTSLSSFGWLEGGAITLITTIQEIIKSDGLLMMPTFTYGKEPYHVKLTPSQTGEVTEVFRNLSGVVRSEHPTHSVAAWGNKAELFVAGHKTESAFCMNSPIHRLSKSGGKNLLIGVGQNENSTIHVAQEIAKVAYLDRSKIVEYFGNDGSISKMKVRRSGCSLGFYKIEACLDKKEINRIKIGNSNIQYFLARDIIEAAVALLKKNQEGLLCDRPACFACNEARIMIRERLN